MEPFNSNHNGNSTAILLIKDNINQTKFYVKVPLSISGLDLMNEIETQNDKLKGQKFRLVFAGKLLNDYFSLHRQGIKNTSVIYLIHQKIQETETSNDSENTIKINDNSAFLYIFQVGQKCTRTRKVKLFLNSLINKLDAAFSTNSLYVYNGMVLDKTNTFNFYNIKNEATIVFIPEGLSKANPGLLDKWINLTNDACRFQTLIDSNTKKTCARESSRLIDIKYNNLELKKRSYHSVFNENNINKQLSNYHYDDSEITKTQYGPIGSPSENPLPNIFA